MGIYLAVYINRDIRGLVRGTFKCASEFPNRENVSLIGTSRSAVTAGLIGGRVGNKGGVGVSINLDGTTLLFVNAHLAGLRPPLPRSTRLISSPAHEGKVHHRLANLAKIKVCFTGALPSSLALLLG
jgi:hypothetical protein